MGLISDGTPLSWEEIKRHSEKLKIEAAKQFIQLYHKCKDRKGDIFLWGDEVEFILVKFDDKNKTAKALLKAESLLEDLKHTAYGNEDAQWSYEFASFMFEGFPNTPYTADGHGLVVMETNIQKRREIVRQLLEKDEDILTVSYFPRTGCEDFTAPERKVEPKTSEMQSMFFPDGVIYNNHTRIKMLARNVHNRRGCNSIINIPIFKDENTQTPFQEAISTFHDGRHAAHLAMKGNIYLDCSAFGFCSCSLQVTLQCSDLEETKYLYDQLVPLCPILMALTAAAPIYKGYLSDYDSRWNVTGQGADDRTEDELECNTKDNKQIRRRWESVACYLSERNKEYNLDNLYHNEDIYNVLLESGVDEGMAQHIAYILTRDPLFIYKENLETVNQDDTKDDTEILDIFNKLNWMTLKLKLPIFNDNNTGWRIELRPMDAQLTNKESAACSVFVVLLSRAILKYKLDFVVPISEVDRNMQKAYKRDAVNKEQFCFKKNIFTENYRLDSKTIQSNNENCKSSRKLYTDMTINEIINGIQGRTPGIISVVSKYVDEMTLDVKSRTIIQEYLAIISARASGDLKTGAKWIRDFVSAHPSYKKDSVVSEEINYDLLKKISELSKHHSTEMILTNYS